MPSLLAYPIQYGKENRYGTEKHRTSRLWRGALRLCTIIGLALAASGLHPYLLQANAAANLQKAWGTPINLSRSGAASQPRIFAAPSGALQVFWIDRFDGLMTALFNGETWSLPAQSQMLPPANRLGVNPTQINNMPAQMLVDASGRLHAFYYGAPSPLNKTLPLIHTQLSLGNTSWQYGTQVAEAAIAFTAIPASDLEMKLFYLRTLKSTSTQTLGSVSMLETEPGVYLRSTAGGTGSWSAPQMLETSPYYRVITADQVTLQAASTGQLMMLMWSEPRLGQLVSAASLDLGKTWPTHEALDIPGQPARPLLTTLPNGQLLRIWQDASQPGCVLYQQLYTLNLAAAATAATATAATATTATETPVASTRAAAGAGSWGKAQRIMEQATSCPENNRFLTNGETLYWVWGETTDNLYLSAWNEDNVSWSLPQRIAFGFQDPETSRFVQLDDLHVTLAGDRLAVTGFDRASGDVWAVPLLASAIELAYAPPLPWTFPAQASDSSQQASHPAITIDQQGQTHLVWNQGASLPGRSLYYARIDDKGLSNATEIVRAAEGEIANQPALLSDSQELLHLVWISGSDGQLSYSRARVREAASPSGWLPAQNIANTLNTSWPQMAIDPSGRLFVVYTVRVNEGRGVYLIQSQDNGDTWSQPEMIFNAAAANWEAVDHPALQITLDGNLHLAFVRGNLSGALSTEVYYTRTRAPLPAGGVGQNTEWIEPVALAEQGADWPRLVSIAEQLHLLYVSPAGLEQRWLPLSEQSSDGLGWKSANRVPDWQELGAAVFSEANAAASAAQQPPYALAADAQTIHLVAPLPGKQALQYSTWIISQGAAVSDATNGVWQTEEVYSPLGDWKNQVGVVAAVPVTGGKLAVAWLAKPSTSESGAPTSSLPAIFINLRNVAEVTVQITPIAFASITLTPTPGKMPTETALPTATLATSLPPPPAAEGLSPFILGGGLAAFIVVLIFAGILLRGKRQ